MSLNKCLPTFIPVYYMHTHTFLHHDTPLEYFQTILAQQKFFLTVIPF